MISEETWLKSFGFERNPFETTEAAGEAHYSIDFLHETFVKPAGFDEILGNPHHPRSSLVFAARGKGKTSARLMTAHFCREGIFAREMSALSQQPVRVLPIQHTRFERVVTARSSGEIVEGHVVEILQRALPALLDMLARYPDLSSRVSQLSPPDRAELRYFCTAFQLYLTPSDLPIARELLGDEKSSSGDSHRSMGFSLPDHAPRRLADVPGREIGALLADYDHLHPIDLLEKFVNLLRKVGFGAVYVLMDCVDELPETAGSFQAAADLLTPLLLNLNLMTNMPYVAFKIYAPSEMEDLLLPAAAAVIRKDRLAIQHLDLTNPNLVEILRRRLSFCSSGVITSIAAISSFAVREQIEGDMVVRAERNPRRLALLGQFMIKNRCQSVGEEDDQEAFLFDDGDLNYAVRILRGEAAQTASQDAMEEPVEVRMEETSSASEPVLESLDWLRNELPAPISLSYLIYQREALANIRIWKLYDLVEASLAFLSQVLLSILDQTQPGRTGQYLRSAQLRLERVSLGGWTACMANLPGMMLSMGRRISIAKACQKMMHQNRDFIRAVQTERNNSAHNGPQTEEECEALVSQFAPPLVSYLSSLRFLRDTRLVKVMHVKKQGSRYVHHCTLYTGDTFFYPKVEIELSSALDCDQLWLISRDGPILLHPLVLATPREDHGEDVWLYQAVDKETVTYKSYGVGMTLSTKQYTDHMLKMIG